MARTRDTVRSSGKRPPGFPGCEVYEALGETDPVRKCERVAALGESYPDRLRAVESGTIRVGRPVRPVLVHPREVPHRGLGSVEGRAALVHAVAHIEFNAINLALDACCRFQEMPPPFHRDWISVAKDEARHFRMLSERLGELGYGYGDLPAHNGLWEAAEKTAHDVLARMALVPRVLEARGLDVTPDMIRRLEEVGDGPTAQILKVILQEEVRHVAIGTRWFRMLCAERQLDPLSAFQHLLSEFNARVRPPFNEAARRAAGFTEEELRALR